MVKNFHIFGKGISFSVSPTIHSAGFQHYVLPFTYTIHESNSIDEAVFCDEQIKTAQLIGAVNTLTVKGNDSEQKIIDDNAYWSGLYTTTEKVKHDFKSVFEIKVVPGLQALPKKPEVVIGTVSAYTTTEDQFSLLFSNRSLCVDVSYKPRQTPLLTAAQQNQGWDTITGVEVLLAQAFDQFLLWTGLEPPREIMAEAVVVFDDRVTMAKGGML
ncbi:Quinate/shikimate 5-dehydrogenase/glutamyl-tRNA reductase [Penicillium expansum]|uniref:Quinate/shikimate 5-dehydrogenase/glutamyl-tRNA reductase n=1 Tax=Penicillium expansum TaxID=27334 RepID=A0A0A2K8E6_PENEN|nr:Quinate/shikimate 5-dehydrogenase/glutamyl-tRNA reductase [Penicillium expansum]KGO60645.1 Quinate/shikimate 5-dehydrogenase/glutamyl-tRNA reductase [Penicillium expansum]